MTVHIKDPVALVIPIMNIIILITLKIINTILLDTTIPPF